MKQQGLAISKIMYMKDISFRADMISIVELERLFQYMYDQPKFGNALKFINNNNSKNLLIVEIMYHSSLIVLYSHESCCCSLSGLGFLSRVSA